MRPERFGATTCARACSDLRRAPAPAHYSFCYHYCIGGQLARFIRIHQKLGDGTAPGLLAGFALSSSVVWQAVDALM